MALSGSFRTTGYNTTDGTPDYATFSWTGTQNKEGNYTDVKWSLTVGGGASSGYWVYVYNRQVKINDGEVGKGSSAWKVYNGTVLLSGTTRVNHNADGTGTFKAYAGVGFYSSGVYNSTATQTFTLDTIPRASSITSISNDKMVINGSNALTVNIARASDSFTHTVKFDFGTYTYSATGQGTSCKYTIPLTWIGYFGNGGSGTKTGTVTVTTFNGTTQIGSAVSKTFTLTCPSASTVSSITNDKMVINGSNALTVNISRVASSFTHTVAFTFGTYTYTATSQGASCKYTIPLTWLGYFGNGGSGTRTGTVKVTTYSGSTQIGSATSKTFTLTCPTPSAISWNAARIVCNGTNAIGVSIAPSVASFTHTVKWAFGSYTNTATNVGTSTSYAPPTTWLNAIQNTIRGTGSVYVTTYYGTQQIGGVVSKNFTMDVPNYSPTFTSVTKTLVQDSSISDWTMYVQGKSKVKFTFNGVAGVYGSQIKSYAVTIDGEDYSGSSNTITTTKALNGKGTLSYTATVTDSRNKTAKQTGTIDVKEVIKPSLVSATISRYNGTEIDDEGTQIYFKFNYSFESYSNFNSTVNKIYYKEATSSAYIEYGSFTNGTATIIKPITFDITKSYDFRVNVTDELGGMLQYNTTVGTAKGLIDVDGIKDSIGLLKMASKSRTVEVGGALEVDGQSRLFGGSYNHSFLSNAGGNYIKFATVTITQNYADSTISFDMSGRTWKQKVSVSMYFSGGATNDPTLSYIGVSGKDIKIYGVKTATSTWDLYCYDSWGYERYIIYNLCSYITINQLNNQVLKYYEIDWHNTPVATLPSGAVASENTYYYDGTYHVFNKSIYYPVGTTLRRCVPSDNMTHVRMVQGTKNYLEVASSLGTFGIDAWVSDVNLKENIVETDVDNALDIINNLRHVQFDWKSNGEHVEIGYIADELEDVFEQLVFEVPQYDEEGNPTGETIKQIYNTTMIPLITKAMQELKAESIAKQQGTENVGKMLVVGADGKLVLSDIPQSMGGDVVGFVDSSNNIVLSGVLNNGTYTVKYEYENGTIEEIGTIVVTDGVAVYVNILPEALTPNDITTIFDGVGYKNGYYASAAPPYYNTDTAFFCSGLMPISMEGNFYIKGCTMDTSLSHTRFGFMAEDGTLFNTAVLSSWNNTVMTFEKLGEQYYKVWVNPDYHNAGKKAYYFYFSASGMGDNVIVSHTPIEGSSNVPTNLFIPSNAKVNYRLNSSYAETSANGYLLSDYIAFAYKAGTKMTIKGFNYAINNTNVTNRIVLFNSSKTGLSHYELNTKNDSVYTLDTSNLGEQVITFKTVPSGASYIRLSLNKNNDLTKAITSSDIQDIEVFIE